MSDLPLEIRDARHVGCARRSAYPVRGGNSVRPLIDGEEAFRRICEAVEAARDNVLVTVAYLETDVPMPDGRGSFFDVLDAAAARGVDVRVLFWREPRLAELERSPGDILQAWRDASPSAIGTTVEWDGRTGVTAGIDDGGALLVRTDGGIERIIVGHLHWHHAVSD